MRGFTDTTYYYIIFRKATGSQLSDRFYQIGCSNVKLLWIQKHAEGSTETQICVCFITRVTQWLLFLPQSDVQMQTIL